MIINMLLAFAMAITADTPAEGTSAQYEIAKRFVAAVKGKSAFVDADFTKPLRDKDKAFFTRFDTCRNSIIGGMVNDTPQSKGKFVEVFDTIATIWDCKHVSQNTPVGLTLHFKASKIETIELNNFDLIKAK